MRRDGDQIVSRRGQKYKLDCASWTTYRNFKDMYVHNYAKMEVAGVAKLLDTPQWQDKDGDICDEAQVYGYKITHKITHPEYYVVMDEVGGNINLLSRAPLMCVMIFAGKCRNAMVELGIDPFADEVGGGH